jgi:hypothetical protein
VRPVVKRLPFIKKTLSTSVSASSFSSKLYSTPPVTPQQRTRQTHNMNPFHTVAANDVAFWSRGGIQEEDQMVIWSGTAGCAHVLEFNSTLGGPITCEQRLLWGVIGYSRLPVNRTSTGTPDAIATLGNPPNGRRLPLLSILLQPPPPPFPIAIQGAQIYGSRE